ncbi:hypothetical protein EX30DRAFT_348686 [Ascodesmis nigricans]|uniref:Uncharacterized protein n=1 Tax=Ascodesmis nigricans TaxID=341454 RepID=A0A4S2MXX4_9PEZI|nr:hypothetical protein EX30DRAFT_348686 [Ascodesmis nigricans]
MADITEEAHRQMSRFAVIIIIVTITISQSMKHLHNPNLSTPKENGIRNRVIARARSSLSSTQHTTIASFPTPSLSGSPDLIPLDIAGYSTLLLYYLPVPPKPSSCPMPASARAAPSRPLPRAVAYRVSIPICSKPILLPGSPNREDGMLQSCSNG